jgi:hypothetical protein
MGFALRRLAKSANRQLSPLDVHRVTTSKKNSLGWFVLHFGSAKFAVRVRQRALFLIRFGRSSAMIVVLKKKAKKFLHPDGEVTQMGREPKKKSASSLC